VESERFQKIAELFEAARHLQAAARTAYLEGACGRDAALRSEVERLLGEHELADGVLEESTQTEASPSWALPNVREAFLESAAQGVAQQDPLPREIGGYEIVSLLGQGGMGRVFEALQKSPRRTVALKVISSPLATDALLKRFEYESYLLGLLQHPGIARIYEASTAETPEGRRPFFAMEMVPGKPLTEYCDDAGLNQRDRLELFAKICEAIHHAHQKGIVHRDLKPGNILVDAEGQPKILDFGVARATDTDLQQTVQQTSPGQVVGTLAYMSPEQASGDSNSIDTRSDIYSLGVLLYEILAGKRPLDVETDSLYEVLRRIREQEPPRLSTIHRSLRGDVETIVGKALEKEKERRYASATDLSADIRRYLNDEPISAHAPSAVYQLRKLARRNKILVGGVVLVLLVLCAGIAGVSWQAAKARFRQRQEEAVSDMLQSTFRTKWDAPVSTVLRATGRALDEDTRLEPKLRAAQLHALGAAYYGIGFYDDSERRLREALTLRREELGDDDLETAATFYQLALTRLRQGDYGETRKLLEVARKTQVARLGESHLTLAATLDVLAAVLFFDGKGEESVQLYERILEIQRVARTPDHPDITATLHRLGTTLSSLGQSQRAEDLFQEAIGRAQRFAAGRDSLDVALAQQKYADHCMNLGAYDRAESLLLEAIRVQRRELPQEHPDQAAAMFDLARLRLAQNDIDEAWRLANEALLVREKVYPAEHKEVAASLYQLGDLALKRGDVDRCHQSVERALSIYRKLYGTTDRRVGSTLSLLAEAHAWRGDYDHALAAAEEALEVFRSAKAKDRVPWQLGNLGSLCLRMRDPAGAEAYLRQARRERAEVGGESGHSFQIDLLLARALEGIEPGTPEAESLARRALSGFQETLGEVALFTAHAQLQLGLIFVARRDYEAAEPFLRAGHDIVAEGSLLSRDELSRVKQHLGSCLLKLGRPREAEPLLFEVYRRSGGGVDNSASVELLLQVYDDLGEPERASELRAKLSTLPRTDQGDVLAVPSAREVERRELQQRAEEKKRVQTLSVTLRSLPFQSDDPRVQHKLSYWDLREETGNYRVRPALEVISVVELTSLTVPVGVLLPRTRFFWRVLHVGTDGRGRGYSDERSFVTGDLPLEVVPFDLSGLLNRDVVADPQDSHNDALDGDGRSLLPVNGLDRNGEEDPRVNGVPQSGRIGVHVLGSYEKSNALQFAATSRDTVTFEVPARRYVALRFLVSGGNGASSIPVDLKCADGDIQRHSVPCDDWFHDNPSDPMGTLQAGVTAIWNRMDRIYLGSWEDADDPALFEVVVRVDASSELKELVFEPAGRFFSGDDTRFNLLAITGIARLEN